MKLSKKKEAELYQLIHNEIMDARVKINQLMEHNHLQNPVDEIIYKLQISCPDKATKIFNK